MYNVVYTMLLLQGQILQKHMAPFDCAYWRC